MKEIHPDHRTALKQRLDESLAQAQTLSTRLTRRNNRLLTLSLSASFLATLIAGLATAKGSALVGKGPVGWRLTCGSVACATALATFITGFHQKTSIAERMAKATACLGRLKALELALSMNDRDVPHILHEYEEILANYQDCLS